MQEHRPLTSLADGYRGSRRGAGGRRARAAHQHPVIATKDMHDDATCAPRLREPPGGVRTCRAASESWTAHKIVSVTAAPPSSTQAPSERGLPRPQPTSHHLVAFARLTVRLLGGSGPNPESDPTFRLTADLPSARFRSISTKAGHYESFYIADTLTPRGAWIRYTILKRPDRLPRGSLWCTLWSGAEPSRAQKATLRPHELSAGPGELVRIGAGD